jgi:MYXO-CTERM domain-containing protein
VVSGAPGCGCATTGPSDVLAGAALVAAGWIAGRRRRQIRRG